MKLPPYTYFPVLQSSELVLREVQTSDLHELLPICFYDGKQALDVKQAIEMQQRINEDYKQGNSIHWLITDANTKKILGTCGYYRGFDDSTGELGCVLLETSRGRGIMTKSMHLAINFGFETIDLERIAAITTIQNKKAVALLSRLQFQETRKITKEEVEYVLPRSLWNR